MKRTIAVVLLFLCATPAWANWPTIGWKVFEGMAINLAGSAAYDWLSENQAQLDALPAQVGDMPQQLEFYARAATPPDTPPEGKSRADELARVKESQQAADRLLAALDGRVTSLEAKIARQAVDLEASQNTAPDGPAKGKRITVAGKTYIAYDNGTALDTQTGLLWMRCLLGQTWTDSNCSGKAKKFDWEAARKQTASFAGYDDWRISSPRAGETPALPGRCRPQGRPPNAGPCPTALSVSERQRPRLQKS